MTTPASLAGLEVQRRPSISPQNDYIVLGLDADGDLPAGILRTYEAAEVKGLCIVIEKDPRVLEAVKDKLPANPDLHVFSGMPPEEIASTLLPILSREHSVRVNVLSHAPSTSRHPAYYAAVEEVIRETVLTRLVANQQTVFAFGKTFAWNTLRNLEWFAGARTFPQERPAGDLGACVLCGAGPALDDAIPQLLALRDVPIIAADSALIPLRKAGINPAVVGTIDIQARKAAVFRANQDLTADIWAQLTCSPRMSNSFATSPVWLHTATPHARWMFESVGRFPPAIPEPLTVINSLYAACANAGYSPVYLVGVDLAHTAGERYHAAGSEHVWSTNKTLHDSVRTMEVAGFDGDAEDVTWLTSRSMYAAGQSLGLTAYRAQSVKGTVSVNANTRGAHIANIPRGDLNPSGGGILPDYEPPIERAALQAAIHALRDQLGDMMADLTLLGCDDEHSALDLTKFEPAARLAYNTNPQALFQARQQQRGGDHKGSSMTIVDASLAGADFILRVLKDVEDAWTRKTP